MIEIDPEQKQSYIQASLSLCSYFKIHKKNHSLNQHQIDLYHQYQMLSKLFFLQEQGFIPSGTIYARASTSFDFLNFPC